jgi:hypothetical protein
MILRVTMRERFRLNCSAAFAAPIFFGHHWRIRAITLVVVCVPDIAPFAPGCPMVQRVHHSVLQDHLSVGARQKVRLMVRYVCNRPDTSANGYVTIVQTEALLNVLNLAPMPCVLFV